MPCRLGQGLPSRLQTPAAALQLAAGLVSEPCHICLALPWVCGHVGGAKGRFPLALVCGHEVGGVR